MPRPRVDELVVDGTCLLGSLRATLIILQRIVRLRPFGGGTHVDDSIVALVAQFYGIHLALVQDGLPHLTRHIGSDVHRTTVAHDERLSAVGFGNTLEMRLHLHLEV